MADTPGVAGGDNSHRIAAAELRAFAERIERLTEEGKTIADDIKDVMGEAKGRGYDAKVLKKVIAIRKSGRDEWNEYQALVDTYLDALGAFA